MEPSPTTGTPPPPVWMSFAPTLLLGVLTAGIVLWLAPRKGRSKWLALAAVIPCVGIFVVPYLLSLTDQRVLDDLAFLKKQIGARDEHNPNVS